MSKVIHKLTGHDIITQAAYESPDNREAGQVLGYTNDVPETIAKRDASGIITVSGIESTSVSDPGDNSLGFFGASLSSQPSSIDAPILTIAVANDNDEESAEYSSTQAAVAELQEKVGEIITALENLGLIAT